MENSVFHIDQVIDISVIVTVYNIEQYIGECLDSILRQEGVSFEVICVDDGSLDGSLDILLQYEKKDERVKVIQNKKNMGAASSRNTGFRYAKGKYLYTIDGDDLLEDGALQKMFFVSENNKVDFLGFSATGFYDNGMEGKKGDEDYYDRRGDYPDIKPGAELLGDLLEAGDRACYNIVLYFYRRDFFLENNLYGIEGLKYADDSVFAFFLASKRAMCIPDRLYLRRYRKGSLTTGIKKEYLESMIVLYVHELQIWQKAELNRELNKKVERHFDQQLKYIKAYYSRFKDDIIATDYLDENMIASYFYKRFIVNQPLYVSCFTERYLKKLNSAEHIILYGAGTVGEEAAETLEYLGYSEYDVAITQIGEEEREFRGRKIFEIEDLLCQYDNYFIIVSARNGNQKEMLKTLEKLGVRDVLTLY